MKSKCYFIFETITHCLDIKDMRSFVLCRQFTEACGQALEVNERLIKEDQLEYQEEMKSHYKNMLSELSEIMNEQVSHYFSIFHFQIQRH